MIDQADALRVLEAAQENGADFAELFFEDSTGTQLRLQGGCVESANYTRVHGAGVRVLSGVNSAYAYTADTSMGALLETARAAAAALPGGAERRNVSFAVAKTETVQRTPFAGVCNDRRVKLLKDAYRAARDASPEVTQVVCAYLDKVRRVLIASTDGVFSYDEQPRTRAMVQAVAMRGAEAQTGYEGPGCCRGFEAYEAAIDVESAARTAARTAVTMLNAPDCPAGVVPVVIDGGFGGVIFHEACGHSLEATSVAKGNSEFCGKLGAKIAADCVSAVDDGTLENEWGSMNVDDEGMPPRRNLLIERGVLKGYLIDRLGERRMHMARTGSARRQGYAYAPTSRMTNTLICAGSDDEEEMLRTMGEGLYAKRMGGGSVNPATGEFNFSVGEGYWVKNGAIFCPVRGATLIGKGADVLMKIDRVGPRMWMAQGMCGSASGSVPTNVGQPRIRIAGMTVGGKGGAL